MRQVNIALRGKLEWEEYSALVRNGAIRRMVEYRAPKPDETKPQLPAWIAAQVAEEGQRVADVITSSGVRVIGDLDILSAPPTMAPSDDLPADQTMIPVEAMIEAVVGAVAGATYGSWSLDEEKPDKPMLVEETTAARLAAIVATRAGNRVRRTVRRS